MIHCGHYGPTDAPSAHEVVKEKKMHSSLVTW